MTAVTPSDGPIALTGASGYIGTHTAIALLNRGYDVRACITDASNPHKTQHLLALNEQGFDGTLSLHSANLLELGSYDEVFQGCAGLLHVGTPMGYGNANSPQQVYDGAIQGMHNVLSSVQKSHSIRRVIYTSSFAAISHPAPSGYRFSETDWASDNREQDMNWSLEDLDDKGEVGYAMSKVTLEKLLADTAVQSGQFDAAAINPIVVLGPLLSEVHELVGSWQWHLGRMLAGKTCRRGWQHLWNIVDVRDVADAHVLALAYAGLENGTRYQLSATDESGELSVPALQAHLQSLFPDIEVAGPPQEIEAILSKHGQVFQAPLAHCDKARSELGLTTHGIEDTLRQTGETMIELGLVAPNFH